MATGPPPCVSSWPIGRSLVLWFVCVGDIPVGATDSRFLSYPTSHFPPPHASPAGWWQTTGKDLRRGIVKITLRAYFCFPQLSGFGGGGLPQQKQPAGGLSFRLVSCIVLYRSYCTWCSPRQLLLPAGGEDRAATLKLTGSAARGGKKYIFSRRHPCHPMGTGMLQKETEAGRRRKEKGAGGRGQGAGNSEQ